MLSIPINRKIGYERLEARISTEKKNLLKHAADLLGKTLTEFIISSSYDAAVHIVQEHEQLHLSLKDHDLFMKTLLKATKPSRSLVAAAKRYQKNVISK